MLLYSVIHGLHYAMIIIIAVSVMTFVFFFDTNFYAAILIFLLFIYYSYLPVLAAAPDIKHPFSRISPVNPHILPKNPRELGQIL